MLVKENNISGVNFHIDMQYLIRKLDLQNTVLTLSNVADNKEFNFTSIKAIDYLIQLPQYAKQPLVILNLAKIKFIKAETEESYLELLDLLEKYYVNISIPTLNDFYTLAINFCIRKITAGEIQYNRYLYELFKIMDKKDLLAEDGLIDIIRLKNIVGLSCRMKDFVWARALIEKYKNITRHKDKASVEHFNLGTIAFYEASFNEAISHFIRVKKINTAYDVNSRMMLAKTLYELSKDYDDRVMTKFKSAERFITQHKTLNFRHKKSFKNFIKILIKIYKMRFGLNSTYTTEKIITEMELFKAISDKNWLLDKLNEL